MPGTPGVGHSPADAAEAAKPDVTALADQASRVDIRGMQFTPAELRVSVGDTVIWTHSDRAPHTVTGREAAGPESQTLQPGSTFSYRFDEPGTYEYYCALHPSMSGSIIVE
jgi:plastocyanin